MSSTRLLLLKGFDDAHLDRARWQRVLEKTPNGSVFQTWEWTRSWWKSFHRGTLLLLAVEKEGAIQTVAPLFEDGSMVFFVGSGGSDYLDFVGGSQNADLLASILDAARSMCPEFLGFRFYHVPDDSPTGRHLNDAAGKLGLKCFDEGDLAAPSLCWDDNPELQKQAASKTSLVRHEKYFLNNGQLLVHDTNCGEEILPYLEEFFAQHVERWSSTPYHSLFEDPAQRMFYRELVQCAANTGWLRFTRLEWGCRHIAFHFGFCFAGTYLWYKPSFDIDLARRSPGEVLLRQLLLAAAREHTKEFDFGLGEEPFKARFANRVRRVRTWGIYPKEVIP